MIKNVIILTTMFSYTLVLQVGKYFLASLNILSFCQFQVFDSLNVNYVLFG